MKIPVFYCIMILALCLSCNVGPKDINYGNEYCHFCQMTIVDPQHAAQMVTTKGKVYNFDAIECMIHYTKEFDTTKVAMYLTCNYTQPGILLNAEKANFIVSENIPSPMGANLSAVSSETEAKVLLAQQGGSLFDWQEIKTQITTD